MSPSRHRLRDGYCAIDRFQKEAFLRSSSASHKHSALVAIPTDRESLTRSYTMSAHDRRLVADKRGDRNWLRLAVQLAYLRHPGQALAPDEEPPAELLAFLGRQL